MPACRRLAGDISPVAYTIELCASPRRRTFTGQVTIRLRCLTPTTVIELHARDLRLADVEVRQRGRRQRPAIALDREQQLARLTLARPLGRGPAELRLAFRGRLSTGMHGLYLAKDGSDRAVVSQCEASDARAIFPCFDEPRFKASLTWTVRTDPGLQVITNGPLRSLRRRGRECWHRFAPTRPIPTYLAAVTIGDYEATPPERIGRVPCRVVCGRGKLPHTAFARAVTRFCLPWYERYFGHRFPFRKLDQVAVPGFDAGAMENAGAVFYRQGLLLMQPGTTSWAAEKRIAEVVAHELAHMWFGNLVTLAWWDDLWLNEAFATWVAYRAVDRWQPEWRLWDDTLEARQAAMAVDALCNTHAIYAPVDSPAAATEMFDLITYEKGCAVLRMAEQFLGAPAFTAGLRRYMRKHAYANAEGADLWAALGQSTGQPVAELMQSWIMQPGLPLVTLSTEPGSGGRRLRLTQRRFFAHPRPASTPDPARWQIPLLLRWADADGAHQRRLLLTEPEQSVELPAPAEWCFPNADAVGFFRVQLEPPLLDALVGAGLAHLRPAERVALLEDQWALVHAGLARSDQFMRVLAALHDEADHVVTRAMAARLSYLDNFLVDDQARPRFAQFVRELVAAPWASLGWEGAADEAPQRSSRRATLVHLLGHVGQDPEIQRRALALCRREMADPRAVHPDLAPVVIHLAARTGDRGRLDQFVRTYLARRRMRLAPELQARYLHALARFEEPRAVDRVLRLCLDGTVPQDQLRLLLSPLLHGRSTGRRAWAFIKQHWTELMPLVGDMALPRLVESVGNLPLDLRDDVERFFTAHPVPAAQRAVHKALEALDLRRELWRREAAHLSTWLQQGGRLETRR